MPGMHIDLLVPIPSADRMPKISLEADKFAKQMISDLCMFMSKKPCHRGGMAPSEWMRSITAARDTPVADYSALSAKTTRCVAYPPPIVVSQFLLTLSVSYCKRTLRGCGQL